MPIAVPTPGTDPAPSPRAGPAPSPGADDAPEPLAVALHEVARSIRTAPQVAGVDLLPPTELDVMRVVASHPGVSVGDTATLLRLRPSNVSAAVRGLLARGLVLREPDPRDGRVVRLRATARAMEHRRLIEAVWSADVVDALGLMGPEDRAALLAAAGPLARLAVALDHTRAAAAGSTQEGPGSS